jgi:prolyl 4-hydroxylase
MNDISAPWRSWIEENVRRGCDHAELARLMVASGGYDTAVAHQAVADCAAALAQGGAAPAADAGARPEIPLADNSIALPDRTVHVLMSYDKPRIVLLGSFLADAECDALAAHGRERLEPSPVVSSDDGENQLHAGRTSRGLMLQRAETPLVAAIEARLAALTGWPAERGEGLQVLHYGGGNEYRPHFDWFDPGQAGGARHLARGGQRLATVILYLSDVAQGGATAFPSLGLQIAPRKGNALFFANTDAARIPEQLALHAGVPVHAGTKVIATKWLREFPY